MSYSKKVYVGSNHVFTNNTASTTVFLQASGTNETLYIDGVSKYAVALESPYTPSIEFNSINIGNAHIDNASVSSLNVTSMKAVDSSITTLEVDTMNALDVISTDALFGNISSTNLNVTSALSTNITTTGLRVASIKNTGILNSGRSGAGVTESDSYFYLNGVGMYNNAIVAGSTASINSRLILKAHHSSSTDSIVLGGQMILSSDTYKPIVIQNSMLTTNAQISRATVSSLVVSNSQSTNSTITNLNASSLSVTDALVTNISSTNLNVSGTLSTTDISATNITTGVLLGTSVSSGSLDVNIAYLNQATAYNMNVANFLTIAGVGSNGSPAVRFNPGLSGSIDGIWTSGNANIEVTVAGTNVLSMKEANSRFRHEVIAKSVTTSNLSSASSTISNLLVTNASATNITTSVLSANNFVGMVAPFATSTVPSGWLYCDGSTVSRTSYADLFSAIGTTWGAGDSTSTFSLPDFRGVFMRGIGTGSYGGRSKGGLALAEFQEDKVQEHTHGISLYGVASDGGNNYHWLVKMEQLGDGWVMQSVQEGLASYGMTAYGSYGTARFGYETQPYCVGVKYCIKY